MKITVPGTLNSCTNASTDITVVKHSSKCTSIIGRGQPLSLTLSFGEFLWFDIRGEIQRRDWSEKYIFVCAQYDIPGYDFKANHSAVFPLVHETTQFCQTSV